MNEYDPATAYSSALKFFEEEAGLGNAQGLVREFLVALKNAGSEVEELKRAGPDSNARIVKKGKVSICTLLYQYNAPGSQESPIWPEISTALVEKMKKYSATAHGAVFLLGSGGETWDCGFWVQIEALRNITELKDGKKHYEKVRLKTLEDNPSHAKPFKSIDSFLQIMEALIY